MKKIQLNVNEEVYEKYQQLCKKNDTSVAVTIRDAMKRDVGFVNEKHKHLGNAIDSMHKLALLSDSDLANKILDLKTKLMIATLGELD